MFKTLVQCDGRLRNATFVVEDDHVIRYAGTSFHLASASVRGSGMIAVWHDDKWMGNVDYEGRWKFTTKNNPCHGIGDATSTP